MPVNVQVNGAGAFVDALSKFNKEIYKILQDEVRDAASLVANNAKGRIPQKILYGGRSTGSERMSPGWGLWTASGMSGAAAGTDLGWNQSRVVNSIRSGARKASIRRAGVVGIKGIVSMQDAAGQKWAKAGQDQPRTTFNHEIISRYGDEYPRALKAALFAKGPEAGEAIDRAIDRAQARWLG